MRQLPQQFNLKYDGEDGGSKTPVLIHRALLGSVERMLAMLAEHHAGRLPEPNSCNASVRDKMWIQVAIVAKPSPSLCMHGAPRKVKRMDDLVADLRSEMGVT